MSIKLLINLAIPNCIKRSLVGAYEEERAEPKYELLKTIATFFEISIDDFIKETINDKWAPAPKGNLRILSISVDKDDNENIELVPLKASAGYLNGYADPEYVAQLPKFYLPMFKQGTYRAFEIKGDSMLPLVSGTIIIGEYSENWGDVKSGETYVIVSKSEGVVYKRMGSKFKADKKLKLISDNPVYEPYEISGEDVLEIWKAKAYISTQMPLPAPEPTMESLTSMMAQMQRSISNLQQKN
jgi:phage repressor protein C with HTH and peptisase S24 domain